MARQGYDDTDNIAKVQVLMQAEPDLTRQAAIKRIVGANRSNVRRIETKMTRMAATPSLPSPSVVAEPPRASGPVEWSEARFAAISASAVLVAVAVWTLWPEAYIYPMLGILWVQVKLGILMTGPLNAAGTAAMASIERFLTTDAIGAMNQQVLTDMRHGVMPACQGFLAAAITATMACSVWRFTSPPSGQGSRRDESERDTPLGIRANETLRNPRNALVAIVCLGGLGCAVPVMADFALVSMIVLTFCCTVLPPLPGEALDGRRQ